jgi:hypothetical protein
VVGLVGGVGALGAAQGWSGFTEMNTALGGEAAAASSATQTMLSQPTVGAPDVGAASPGGVMGADAVSASPTGAAMAEPGVLQQAVGEGGTRTMSVGEMLNESGRAATGANPLNVAPDVVTNPYVPDVGQTGQGLMGLHMGAAPAAGELSVFDKMLGFVEKNPTAASMLGKGALDFGAAWFKDTDVEDEQKRAMTDLYRERATTEAEQRANAGYVPSVASKFAQTPGLSPFKTAAPSYTAPRMSGGLMSR